MDFRKRKNAHGAIKRINLLIMRKKMNYIVDADIKGFFDNVNHEWLIKFLENDIEDKRFIRYIKRFLIAGIMENGKYTKKIVGHYAYYGIFGNFKSLVKFHKYIVLALYKMLIRRSQRSYLNWGRYYKSLTKHPITTPKLYVNIW